MDREPPAPPPASDDRAARRRPARPVRPGPGDLGRGRRRRPRRAGDSVTVPAPDAGDGATVTVSRTAGLVNQTVNVSWTGFRPSSATRLQNSGDSLDVNTENPVRVYECRGAAPASSSDCYGSPGYRGQDATDDARPIPAVSPFTYPGQTDAFDATPDGPANWQDNVTHADGTGEVTIQVFTKRESAALGCDADSPCSIVVVPNYGRPQGNTEDRMDAPWAWVRRTVVPLTFQPVDDACPLSGTSLRVEGSPMAGGLLAAWRGRTCTLGKHAVTLDYTAIGEPQTRGDVASGTTDTGAGDRPARRPRRRHRRRRLLAGQHHRPRGRLPGRRRPRPPGDLDEPERPAGRQADHRVVPLRWRPGGDRQPGQPLPRSGVPQAQPGRGLAGRRPGQPPAAPG